MARRGRYRASMDTLSAAEARRVALAAQGFAARRPRGRIDRRHLLGMLDRIVVLQVDSVNVLVRSHELPLYSRLGPYPRDLLRRLAYGDHSLFEYWAHRASVVPTSLHPLLRWRMARATLDRWRWPSGVIRNLGAYVEAVYQEVAARGPLAAAELSDGGASRGPWWGWSDGKEALEFLFWSGRLTAADRRGTFERVYDLTERVLPAEILAQPDPSLEDAQHELVRLAARALGVMTVNDLVDYFHLKVVDVRAHLRALVEAGHVVPVTVEGWAGPAYLWAEAPIPRQVEARALVSPFDSLVWTRPRTERLFGMRYRIEIYTPAPKRVYGYYVLPFVLGDDLVARVDLKADRAARVLLAPAIHAEPGVDATTVAGPLAEELVSMAGWLGLSSVVGARGNLASPVRAALART